MLSPEAMNDLYQSIVDIKAFRDECAENDHTDTAEAHAVLADIDRRLRNVISHSVTDL